MSWKLLDISTLRNIDLFQHVGDDALVEIMDVTSTRNYNVGQTIFEQGDSGDALYYILEGSVRISTDIKGLGEEVLAFLEEGSCFGEGALFGGEDEPRSANAIADSDCHLGLIPRDDVLELMEDDPELANELLWSFVSTLYDRLVETNEKVAFFALNTMYE